MKKLLKNYVKFGLLLFGVCFITFACQEESIDDIQKVSQEVPGENTVKRISLNKLNARIGNSNAYAQLSTMFDINHTESSGYQQRLENSDNPYLLTDEIVVVEIENSTFYTFRIESNATGNEFYNLVVAMDESNDIRSAKILEYIPSSSWLEDTSQPFTGELKTQVNNIFSTSEIGNILPKYATVPCVTGVSGRWLCNYGNNHDGPGEPEDERDCTSWEYIITVQWGTCPNTGGGGDGDEGGFPIGGSPGGGGDSDGNSTPGNDGPLTSEDPICGGCTPTVPVVPSLDEDVALRFKLQKILQFPTDSNEHNWLYNQATHEQLQRIDGFFEENESGQESQDLVIALINILLDENQPSIDIVKFLNLKTNIEDNPNYLMENYAVSTGLTPLNENYEDWQDLAQYQLPETVTQKIEDLSQNNNNADWDIQLIENAGGANVNMDYFPVKITQLPNKPFTNEQFTAPEFLQYVRTHINDFTKDEEGNSLSTFSPSNVTGEPETEIWYTYESPLTAILHIDIPGNDGSVICSKYNSTEWYFTTLTTPFLDGDDYDGTHPVSGNRAFGIKQNPDGSYTIFTRGVDRVRYRVAEIVGNYIWDSVFEPADDLWSAFQNRLAEFINSAALDGQAQVLLPATNRVDFEAVRDDLMGN